MMLLLALTLELFADWVPDPSEPHTFLPIPSSVVKQMEQKGWEIVPWKKNEENIWVFWNLGPRARFGERPKEKMILWMWEPPTVQEQLYDPAVQDQFGKVFTWDDDLVDGKRFFKFHYPVLRQRISEIVPFEKKKFCTMIARKRGSKHPKQLYKEREKIIRFFEKKKGEFDLYGHFWQKKKFKNWKGPIDNKIEVLKGYKYSICYENAKDLKGYITEKIFDCFEAGVVPVYLGASNITDYIPADCFIDRRKFKNDKALYRFLKKITQEQYEQYLKRAEEFLSSEQAKLFTEEHFAQTFLKVIE